MFVIDVGKILKCFDFDPSTPSTFVQKAQTPTKATPHYLRHTFDTNLFANGADLLSVQEILGYASVATTKFTTKQQPPAKSKS